jgi:hypothetical protein
MPMKFALIAGMALVAGPVFAQSGPPPGPPPDFQSMRAEHQRLEAEWADCKAIADGTARATCYEKVHDEGEAATAKREAERRNHGGPDRPPPQ